MTIATAGSINGWRAWHEPTGLNDNLDWRYEAYDGHTKWSGRVSNEADAVRLAQASLDRIIFLAAMYRTDS